MRNFLLYLSSLLAIFSLKCQASGNDISDARLPLAKYSFQIDASRGYVSGILIANEDNENIYGSMVNEFGVSAIDFVYSKKQKKVRLESVVSFLNKWYIKRVLKNDIKYCLQVLYASPQEKQPACYEMRRGEKGEIVVNNTKRGLVYTFTPLKDETKE